MDVEFLNLTPESQMDLMNMMMHVEKLSEFPEHQVHQLPSLPADFSSGGGPSIPHPPPPTPFINFVGTTSQENLMSFDTNNQASVAAMREMIFRVAAMQPIHIDPESVKPPKRRNVRMSKDPQSVAARHRRERISERIRILQRLVPGGTKMDTASMLDEAIHYVKFLKSQVQYLERSAASRSTNVGLGFRSSVNYSCLGAQHENISNTYS